eukprot:472009-Prymnesium_polylepis.2
MAFARTAALTTQTARPPANTALDSYSFRKIECPRGLRAGHLAEIGSSYTDGEAFESSAAACGRSREAGRLPGERWCAPTAALQ